jgi:hypothetical protein
MRESEVRANLLGLYEKAEKLEREYPDGLITKPEDQEAQQARMAEIKELEGQLEQFNESSVRRAEIEKGLTKYGTAAQGGGTVSAPVSDRSGSEFKSLGDIFVDSEEYATAEAKGLFDSNATVPEFSFKLDGFSMLEHKNLLYTGSGDPGMGTASGEPFESLTRRPGYLPLLYADRTFLSMVPRIPTDEEIIEYVSESSFTNSAAMVAEATATTGTSGTKPQSTMAFTVATSTVRDMAHWMAVTNKMLRNKAAIRGLITERLVLGLDIVLEAQVVSGDGTGQNLTGILNAGIQVQGKGSDNTCDAIHKALTKCRVTGLINPNVILMHPNDWQEVRLLRVSGTTGEYLYGPPAIQGPQTMWGLPVTLTQSLAEGTALVGDMNQVTLFDRMRTIIRTGLINDQLTRNMQTILAELAVTLVTWRPDAFCKVTGI